MTSSALILWNENLKVCEGECFDKKVSIMNVVSKIVSLTRKPSNCEEGL
jgi:hypothetical protein